MKVFYKYGNYKSIPLNRGDFITEYHIMKAISRFAEVAYDSPDRDCDLYYVRANPTLFKMLPNPKIYFASPYDKEAFRCADAIATFTEPWTDYFRRGRIPIGDGTTDTLTCPPSLKAITINQVIDDSFKPLQNHPRTKQIREELGGGFIVGHFGAIRESSYPYSLLHILPELVKEYSQLNVVFCGATGDFGPHVKTTRYAYHDMPYATSACDLILYNVRNVNGHIGGSMNVLESMACGVPIFSPRMKAREWELGEDYEYFHPFEPDNKGRYSGTVEKKMKEIISTIIEDEKLRKEISSRLISRSEYWNIGNSAERFKKIFEGVIG